MLKIWGMQSAPLLPLLPDPFCPGMVVFEKVLAGGQIELNCIFAKLNCLK